MPLSLGPSVSLLPSARPTIGEALRRFRGAVSLSARSTLRLEGDVRLEKLELDGALAIRAVAGARVTVRRLCVRNAGYRLDELSASAAADTATPEVERLRGYTYTKLAERLIEFDQPGDYVIDEAA